MVAEEVGGREGEVREEILTREGQCHGICLLSQPQPWPRILMEPPKGTPGRADPSATLSQESAWTHPRLAKRRWQLSRYDKKPWEVKPLTPPGSSGAVSTLTFNSGLNSVVRYVRETAHFWFVWVSVSLLVQKRTECRPHVCLVLHAPQHLAEDLGPSRE